MSRPIFSLLCWLLLGGLLLAGVASWPAAAQSDAARRHLDAGNTHYDESQYERAIDAYRRALDTGYANVALYHNLGNAYFRTGRLGRAILYYEKAQRLAPEHPKLRHNLDVARSRAEVPPPPVLPGWKAAAATTDSSRAFALGLALYLVGFGMLGYRRWTGSDRPGRPLYRLTLATGLLLIAGALGTSYVHTLDRHAVVVRTAPLHTIPSTQATQDTTLHEGAVLELRRRQPTWTEVRLANGRTGWLPAETVEEV